MTLLQTAQPSAHRTLAATGNPLVSTAALSPYAFAAAGSYAITATYTPTSTSQGGTAKLTQLVGNHQRGSPSPAPSIHRW